MNKYFQQKGVIKFAYWYVVAKIFIICIELGVLAYV